MVFLALLYGIGTALPLVVGAGLAVVLDPPRTVVAALLAFASGSLLSGLAFELLEPAFRDAGTVPASLCLFAGTGAYVAVKYRVGDSGEFDGASLLAAVVFDGAAENLTLGVALVGGSTGAPIAILVGVAANNLPEAIGGAERMLESGRSPAQTLAIWGVTAVALALTVPVGFVAFSGVGPTTLALVKAAGGGAVLASLAVEIMPDAYEAGGPAVAFATAAGFAVTFLVT